MALIVQENIETITREIPVKLNGRPEKLKLELDNHDIPDAIEVLERHDRMVTDNRAAESPRHETLVKIDFLIDYFRDHLRGWNVGTRDDAYAINDERMQWLMRTGSMMHPVYRDVIDYLTEKANGKSYSEQEEESKNFMRSVVGSRLAR